MSILSVHNESRVGLTRSLIGLDPLVEVIVFDDFKCAEHIVLYNSGPDGSAWIVMAREG